MTAALANAVWSLYGRNDAIMAQSKLLKHILGGTSVALMIRDVQRLRLHIELRSFNG